MNARHRASIELQAPEIQAAKYATATRPAWSVGKCAPPVGESWACSWSLATATPLKPTVAANTAT